MTRQQWLTQFLRTIRPIFRAVGYPLPKIRVGTKRMGQIATAEEVGDTWEISITDDVHTGIRAAESLIPSLVWRHIPWGNDGFHHIAKLVGYTDGPRGERLDPLLTAVIDEMPPYPKTYTRKQWLKFFVHEMRPWFKAAGHTLPSIEIRPGRVIPELLNHVMAITEDGCYIFISPGLNDSLAVAKLLTLDFVACVEGRAASVGIVDGCFTTNLIEHLELIIDRIGPYPEN
jgi:hypothetical protein